MADEHPELGGRGDHGVVRGPRRPRSEHFRRPRMLSTAALHSVLPDAPSSFRGMDGEPRPAGPLHAAPQNSSDAGFEGGKTQSRRSELNSEGGEKSFGMHPMEDGHQRMKRHGREFASHPHHVKPESDRNRNPSPYSSDTQVRSKSAQKPDKVSEVFRPTKFYEHHDSRYSKHSNKNDEKWSKFQQDPRHREYGLSDRSKIVQSDVNTTSSATFQDTSGDSANARGPKMLKLKIGGVTTGSRAVHPDEPKHTSNTFSKQEAENKFNPDLKKRRHRLILEDDDEDEDRSRIPSAVTGSTAVDEKSLAQSTELSSKTADVNFSSMDPDRSGRFPKGNNRHEGGKEEEKHLGSNPELQRTESGGSLEFGGQIPLVPSRERASSLLRLNDHEDEYRNSQEDEEKIIEQVKDQAVNELFDEYEGKQDLDDYRMENEGDEDEEALERMNKFNDEDFDNPNISTSRALYSKQRFTARQLSKQNEGIQLVDFPEGLKTSTPRRRKSKEENETERLLKREEQARKRKLHLEKLAKENEASAIQKILGQDSTRKRKEDRILKQKEMAQDKKATEVLPAINSIRISFKQDRTLVSWSNDVHVIPFSSHISYPPIPEKCIVPSCNHSKRYRDSSSNLPLCSLECYKQLRTLPMWEQACLKKKQVSA